MAQMKNNFHFYLSQCVWPWMSVDILLHQTVLFTKIKINKKYVTHTSCNGVFLICLDSHCQLPGFSDINHRQVSPHLLPHFAVNPSVSILQIQTLAFSLSLSLCVNMTSTWRPVSPVVTRKWLWAVLNQSSSYQLYVFPTNNKTTTTTKRECLIARLFCLCDPEPIWALPSKYTY